MTQRALDHRTGIASVDGANPHAIINSFIT
jgi:hypothetical protein